jgi:hypothetical protein
MTKAEIVTELDKIKQGLASASQIIRSAASAIQDLELRTISLKKAVEDSETLE